jgi:hypothetical protein
VIRISYSQVAAAFSNASRSLAENGERDNTSVAMRFCVASDFCAACSRSRCMASKIAKPFRRSRFDPRNSYPFITRPEKFRCFRVQLVAGEKKS